MRRWGTLTALLRQRAERSLLRGGLLAAALISLAASVSAALPPTRPIAFDILRDGDPIGYHSVTFRRQDNQLVVTIEIDIEVRFAFLTLFRYRHENREVWRDGRLISLNAWTDDDGMRYSVTAQATPTGLRVEGQHGVFLAPSDIIPTSYWNPATVRQARLLDTQRGRVLEVTVRSEGADTVMQGDKAIQTQKFVVSGDLNLEVWYTSQGEWTKIAFEARGAAVSYAPVVK